MHATDLDIEILPLSAELQTDGSISLMLAVTGCDDLVTVTVPSTKASRLLAGGQAHQLDLDEVESAAPPLATMIRAFVGHIREHLTAQRGQESRVRVRRG